MKSRSSSLLVVWCVALALTHVLPDSIAFTLPSSIHGTPNTPSLALLSPKKISSSSTSTRTFLSTNRSTQSLSQRHTSSSSSSSSLCMAMELVDPSYNLALGSFAVGLSAGFLEDIRDENNEKLLTAKPFGALALLFTIFSLFLAFQTTTLRFAFDDDSFSLVKADGSSLGENVVVGGENKWKYSSFLNYDFLPSSNFPILVYFREDQTPIENREEVPIVVDNLDGQVHFFPAITNVQELKQSFEKNACKHI